jgi:hypothetical protein
LQQFLENLARLGKVALSCQILGADKSFKERVAQGILGMLRRGSHFVLNGCGDRFLIFLVARSLFRCIGHGRMLLDEILLGFKGGSGGEIGEVSFCVLKKKKEGDGGGLPHPESL